MDRSVRGAWWARVWNFLFPPQLHGDGAQLQYRGYRLLQWIVAGLVFSALGWIAGGYLGSWAPRTACAAGATALALGWLNRRPGAGLMGAVAVAMVGLAAVWIGESFFSPLLAWPVAGLAIGVLGALAYRRRRARIIFIVAGPILGSVGVFAGMVATFLIAAGLNDSRVSAETMLGGAVGFGLLLLTGTALAGRWLDAIRAPGGGL